MYLHLSYLPYTNTEVRDYCIILIYLLTQYLDSLPRYLY